MNNSVRCTSGSSTFIPEEFHIHPFTLAGSSAQIPLETHCVSLTEGFIGIQQGTLKELLTHSNFNATMSQN